MRAGNELRNRKNHTAAGFDFYKHGLSVRIKDNLSSV